MNTIAFLTTDLLGERSYSINYHLLFFSRCLLENYKDVRIIVFTSEINSKNQNSLTQILIQNDIDVPTERIEVCTCNYRDYLIIGEKIATCNVAICEIYIWSNCLEHAKKINPNIKIISWIHSLLQQEFVCNRHSRWIDYELFITMQETLLRMADELIFDSKYDLDLSNRYYETKSKSTYIYPIPDCKITPSRFFDINNVSLIYPGRWEYRKGIETIIRSAFKLYVEYGMILYILSDTNYINGFENLFVDKISSHLFKCMIEKGAIRTIPWINSRNEYLLFLRQKSFIAIIPSLYDPFNIVAYDCINNNIPLVISNFCGITELITEEMLVEKVNPFNQISIFNGVTKIVDRIRKNPIISNGKFECDSTSVQEKFIKLFNNILQA